MAAPARSIRVAVDEAAIRDRVALLEPAGERRPEVPRHRTEIAELRVRPVAVGADALVPVVRRRGGRVERHRAREGVEPGRLVEVAVDDEQGSLVHGVLRRPVAGRGDDVGHRARPSIARREVDRPRQQQRAALVHSVRSRPRNSTPSRSVPTRRRRTSSSMSPRRRCSRCPGRSSDTSWAMPLTSCPLRTPPMSHHAAGLPPPPSIVSAHSMPTRPSNAGPCAVLEIEREGQGRCAAVAAKRDGLGDGHGRSADLRLPAW